MKYIKLKDGRIIVQGEPSDKGFKQSLFKIRNFGNVETLTPFSNDDILAESSSIEELCDEFVYVSKEDGKHMFHMNGKPHYSEFYDIYAAIWTDKGLIYVAKLSDKGEWELL